MTGQRIARLVAWILAGASSTVNAASEGVVCRQIYKTSNNCYRLYRPARSASGLVVLLPYYGSDADAFSSAALPRLLNSKNIAVVAVSAAGYLKDDELTTLRALVGEVARTLGIPPGTLAIGGISAGGTGAVRYAELCFSGHCDELTTPVAVFSVDAPLDFESWWTRETLNVRRGDPKSSPEESQGILSALRFALGGSPKQVPDAYRKRSPFLASKNGGGNASLLKSVPIRLYIEPDVGWTIENISRDYYTLNALDQAALALQLHQLGNAGAELITTTGRGFRPPGVRNPHSWTIIDEAELTDWLLRYMAHRG